MKFDRSQYDRIVITLEVDGAELEKRRKEFKPKPLKYQKGTLAKYAKVVSDASHGCITDGDMVPAIN